MKANILHLLLTVIVSSCQLAKVCRTQSFVDSLDSLDAIHLAEERGFKLESHTVTTLDSYVLTLHRLVNPLWPNHRLMGPVIVQHGILCASPLFLMNSSPELDKPEAPPWQTADNPRPQTGDCSTGNKTSNSIAFELARKGFDVWLTNFRGTQYSRKHLNLEVQNGPNYWNFNVDTLIENDMLANVRYVLAKTGNRGYTFIGHSLGATVGLGSLLVHQNSELVDKLDCAILMAPVASTQYMRGGLMTLFRAATLLYDELASFPGAKAVFTRFIWRACPLMPRLCVSMADMFVGAKQAGGILDHKLDLSYTTTERDNGNFLKEVNSFAMMMQQSVSIQMLKHIVQVHLSGRLSRYSYGNSQNLAHYGTQFAPSYNLSQIQAPKLKLALVSGPSDAISTPGEVDWIARQVASKVDKLEQITVQVNPFNHMDLVLSEDAGNLVNKQVVEFIKRNGCSS